MGASLAAFFTYLTSRYSVLAGYRKGANLQRKDDLYGPLLTELNYLQHSICGNLTMSIRTAFRNACETGSEVYSLKKPAHGDAIVLNCMLVRQIAFGL